MEYRDAYDPIPLEDVHETHGPNDAGMMTHQFYAFNTIITLQAYADAAQCAPAIGYCADSEGLFDVTVGSAVRLWNFHEGTVPERADVERALTHVDWRALRVSEAGEPGGSWAQLADPQAAVDVGGIAKGWIADRLSAVLAEHGLDSFVVNLGGNVMAHGQKPDGSPWRVGLQDPRDKGSIVGAVTVRDASAAGATVVARRSIDAEGYSTTLLALGIERGLAFARERDAILGAYFVDRDGKVAGIA